VEGTLMLGPRLEPARLWGLTAAGAASFFLFWSAAALAGITSREFLPAPWDVAARFARLVVEPFAGFTLFQHLLSSFQRFALGFVLAVAIGIPFGLLMAWFRWVDRKYIEASQMLGAGSFRSMTQVLLPAAVPSIVAGLRISAGLGWQSLVGAELIVASSGVGYLMVKGQAAVSTATVMSGMIAIGVVGLLIDVALRRLQQVIETRRGL
jgi:NitT/TauT family transport system permease protein